MKKEIIYNFQILLYSDNDKLIKKITVEHWEFPRDAEIQAAIEESGADYAEVRRVYTVEAIPFTEDEDE